MRFELTTSTLARLFARVRSTGDRKEPAQIHYVPRPAACRNAPLRPIEDVPPGVPRLRRDAMVRPLRRTRKGDRRINPVALKASSGRTEQSTGRVLFRIHGDKPIRPSGTRLSVRSDPIGPRGRATWRHLQGRVPGLSIRRWRRSRPGSRLRRTLRRRVRCRQDLERDQMCPKGHSKTRLSEPEKGA
jgi:hypothetical protein